MANFTSTPRLARASQNSRTLCCACATAIPYPGTITTVLAAPRMAAADGCNFPGLGPHPFRRANITWRQQVGGRAIEATKIAGHSDLEMTGEYTFFMPERQNELTRRSQEKLARAIEQVQSTQEGPSPEVPGSRASIAAGYDAYPVAGSPAPRLSQICCAETSTPSGHSFLYDPTRGIGRLRACQRLEADHGASSSFCVECKTAPRTSWPHFARHLAPPGRERHAAETITACPHLPKLWPDPLSSRRKGAPLKAVRSFSG